MEGCDELCRILLDAWYGCVTYGCSPPHGALTFLLRLQPVRDASKWKVVRRGMCDKAKNPATDATMKGERSASYQSLPRRTDPSSHPSTPLRYRGCFLTPPTRARSPPMPLSRA
jgi:hypothetical protein